MNINPIYELEQKVVRYNSHRIILGMACISLAILNLASLYTVKPSPAPVTRLTAALRFENYFIVPVSDEQYHALTNKYPANVTSYPLIFK